MAKLLLTLADQPALLKWAAQHSEPPRQNASDWGLDASAIGVLDRETGNLRAVVVCNARFGGSAMIHISSDRERSWATFSMLRGIFHYIFVALGVERVVASAPQENLAATTLMLKLGFKIDGRVRTSADGRDADVVSTMFASECRWLKEVGNGNG